jgi:nicotinamide mononucleotide adenylyltransferase
MPTIELVSEEQVLGAVKSHGPVIPMDVRQIIKMGDSITIGATLSTLSARGIVKITNIKRGGSPFYYVVGQEDKLSDLSKYLGEKDKRTFELLKQKRVIRDRLEEPLIRVSLRNMPDFAKRIDVELNGEQEIFWRWYTISNEEAIKLFSKTNASKEIETKGFANKELTNAEESSKVVANDIVSKDKTESLKSKDAVQDATIVKEEVRKERIKAKKKIEDKKEPEVPAQAPAQAILTHEVQSQISSSEITPSNKLSSFNDPFINKAGVFFDSGNIVVRDVKQIKKSAEYDLVVEIPTPVGSVEYFCKVKGKKKCTESDLNSAYIQGQTLRLPVLFLTTGIVAKKAKDKLKVDFKGMIVKEL